MKRKLILASNSPRRKELLQLCGVDFEVIPAQHEEPADKSLSIEKAIQHIAYSKALQVYNNHPDDLILAGDTIVYFNNEILGKPKNEEDAKNMLKELSGTKHSVISAICFMSKEDTYIDYEETDVWFAELSEKEIDWYISTGEPFGKAGSYAIQGKGGLFVEKIDGDI